MGNKVEITIEATDKSKPVMDELKNAPEKAKPPVDALGESWGGLTAKIAVATGVIYGVTRAIGSAVKEAANAETIAKRLQFVTEGLGYTWRDLKEEVDRFANSTQEMTRFSDEEARQALIDMMLYTNEYAKAEEGASLAMDMSIRTGMDLTTSARYIGMAMSGNVEMLGRYIPEMRNLEGVLGKTATAQEKAAYATKILHEKFSGTGAADLETYAGKLKQFENYWSDLAEELGNHFLPIATAVLEKITAILKATRERGGPGEVESLFGSEVMRSLYAYDKEYVRGEFAGKPMKPIVGKKDVFADSQARAEAQARAEKQGGGMPSWEDSAEKQFFDARLEAAKYWGDRQVEIQESLNKAILEGKYNTESWLDPLEKAFEIIPENGLEIQERLQANQLEFNKLLQAGGKNTESWLDAIEELPEGYMTIGGEIKKIEKEISEIDKLIGQFGSDLSSAWSTNMTQMIKGAESFGDAVENTFESMGDAFLSTLSKMATNWLIFGSLTGEKGGSSFFGTSGGYGGLIGGIGHILSHFQEGGIVTRPTPAIIGEAGPEAVIPLRDGKIPVEGGGVTYQIINYNQVNDPYTFVRLYGPVVKKLSAQSAAEAKRYGGVR